MPSDKPDRRPNGLMPSNKSRSLRSKVKVPDKLENPGEELQALNGLMTTHMFHEGRPLQTANSRDLPI